MTEAAKAKRSEYQRQWRKKNPDKVRANLERYWEKKANTPTAESIVNSEQIKGE